MAAQGLSASLICFWTLCFLLQANENPRAQDAPRPVAQAPPRVAPNLSALRKAPVNKAEFDALRKQLLYPFSKDDFLSEITRSKAYHDYHFGFRLPFFGFHYSYIWIQKDGYITFNSGLLDYTWPIHFPTVYLDKRREMDPSLIAPWFSSQDIPIEVDDAGVYLRYIEMETEHNTTLVERIKVDFQEGMIGANAPFGTYKAFDPKHVLIITWKNMTFTNRRKEKPLKTNTYQAVLATDEMRTYVMFNYEWIDWITHFDTYDGMNGKKAFVGFNAGNRTRAFEFKPFSQESRVKLLPTRGWGNGLPGRYFFQIDEEIWPGACIERELDFSWPDRIPLTFFPQWGSMLGGTMVNITGPCIFSRTTVIKCKFDIFEVDGVYRDVNHATCISPPTIYHGYVDLAVSLDNMGYFFAGKFYVQPPDIGRTDIMVDDSQVYAIKPNALQLRWDNFTLHWKKDIPLELHLWGYREDVESFPTLTHVTKLAEFSENTGSYVLITETFNDNRDSDKLDLTFGFVSLNISESFFGEQEAKISPTIWSKAMPLGWYFWPQWERAHGKNGWRQHFCDEWHYQEKYSDMFAITLPRCPCTAKQADLDRGRFLPDPECNTYTGKRNCEKFHYQAEHCVLSGRPAVGGAGQQCCYGRDGELIRTGDIAFSGHPSRAIIFGKHPFRFRYFAPTLSFWLHDRIPFFFCCKWAPQQDNDESCFKYRYWRTSQDCSAYQPPGFAAVYGDPHLVTFNQINFTFNGMGEFVLVRAYDEKNAKLDIQGRFEQVEPLRKNEPPINGTRLTAIVAKDNDSATVEFRIRPVAATWRFMIFAIVDQKYTFYWDETMRVQNYKGVTVFSPVGSFNMSHLVAMFDSGAGVEVFAKEGHMSANIYLPLGFKKRTSGLLGNWTDYEPDHTRFIAPDGSEIEYNFRNEEELYEKFGVKWRLSTSNVPNVGQSYFFHDAVPYSQLQDPYFRPYFMKGNELPANLTFTLADIAKVCETSVTCRYDYVTTRSRKFAEQTRWFESSLSTTISGIKEEVIRCYELPRPRNGRKSSMDYGPSAVVTFSCDKGYRLEGHVHRVCRDNGLWSWGTPAECISEGKFTKKVAGGVVGIVIPILLLVAVIIGCIIFRRKQRRDHFTGEQGMTTHPIMEMKPAANQADTMPSEKPLLTAQA